MLQQAGTAGTGGWPRVEQEIIGTKASKKKKQSQKEGKMRKFLFQKEGIRMETVRGNSLPRL